ncbi:MAG: MoaD/ThiS family protein [Aureliella sp.]
MTQSASPTESDSTRLNVEVRLFAAAADLAAARQLRLIVPRGCRLSELIRHLLEQYPALSALAHVSRWAVEEQFVSADFVIDRELAIAMIPPVSGG